MNKLLTCTAALLLLLGTQTTLADDRDGWDRDRGNSRYDRDRHDDRHDNGRDWDRSDNRDWNRRRDNDRDRVSVSLRFGNVWPDYRYRDYHRATSGFGIAYTTAWGAPLNTWGYNSRQPVIVHQNTYINEAPRTRVVTRSSRSGTSVFRDLSGRCFERETNRNGNETRIELPASACDF